ncbi:AAA family ATPase [Phenylobacterium sp.]|uniref:AAA family ATPase n=1 Tax=Phenylobacterium sp. TaxID=1871053 RepID=UPI0035B3A103
MRPLRLTLQAFGPFAGREVVDFRDALDSRVFGIYGQTGAGKTTILDGLCFALFGESSGRERQGEELRSQHATPELETEVSLVFEVGARIYHVVRKPRQTVKAKRGAGSVERVHWAALYEVTDLPLDEISAENPGVVLEERRVEAVGERLAAILGYTADQFRQVVLLPQGQFRELLTAPSTRRSEVLRGLFDVSVYERFVERLKAQTSELRAQILQGRTRIETRLGAEGVDSVDALRGRLVEIAEQVTAGASSRDAARERRDSAQAALQAGRAAADRFAQHETATASSAELEAGADEIAKLAARVAVAEKARACQNPHDRFEECEATLKDADKACSEKAVALDTAVSAHKEAETKLLASQAAEPERRSAAAEVARLSEIKRRLEAASPLRAAADTEAEAAAKAREGFTEVTEARTRVEAERDAARARLTAARDQERSAREGDTKLTVLRQEEAAAASHASVASLVAGLKTQLTEAQSQSQRHKALVAEALEGVSQAEASVTAALAGRLAAQLHEGEACPVCGSTDHPTLAHEGGAAAEADAALEAVRRAWADADGEERKASQAAAALQGRLADAEARLADAPAPARRLEDIAAERASLEADLDLATAEEELREADGVILKVEQALAEATQAENKGRSSLTTAETRATEAAARLDGALRDVPETLRDVEALERARLAAVDHDVELQRHHQEAVQAERLAHDTLQRATLEHQQAEQTLRSASDALKKREAEFDQALARFGLTRDAFAEAKEDVLQHDEFVATIRAHEDAVAAARAELTRTRAAIEGLQRPDLPSLETACQGAETACAEAERSLGQAENEQARVSAALDHVAGEVATLETLSERYGAIGKLAELSEGRNASNIALRDYAIAATFDAVLEAANQRFERMSMGRFRLLRKRDVGDRRSRAGLDIVVLDAHTDQTRDAHTLSGGEGFLASLSLALGLSDVVQAESGGVKLDAIFIDEGFGHLDDETLDMALDTLRQLVGRDRAVGVISHVEAVKQQIPAGFEVRKDLRGSRVLARTAG